MDGVLVEISFAVDPFKVDDLSFLSSVPRLIFSVFEWR